MIRDKLEENSSDDIGAVVRITNGAVLLACTIHHS
jgi:hypothetical protein